MTAVSDEGMWLLNDAPKQHTWDDSVTSLVTFPQILTMMNDKLDWLQKLGDAFLAQGVVTIGLQVGL